MLSPSRLSTFQECPEKYRLKHLEHLVLVEEGEESVPKRFGEALHAGLSSWYDLHHTQSMLDRFLTLFPKPFAESDRLYTPQTGSETLRSYVSRYEVLEQSWDIMDVETPIILHLTDTIPYLVKPDLIVKLDSGYWVMETKTTASPKAFRDVWWNQFEPNPQLSAQIAACQQQYGACEGVILNGMKLSYGPRKGFVAEFQRQSFHRSAEQLEDWKRNTLSIMSRMESLDKQAPVWEKHESMCAWCEYRPICVSVGSQGVKEAMYRVRNPVAAQEPRR